MKKSGKNKYSKKIWDKMRLSLQRFLISKDQTALHEFRVQVKKIKAILTLIKGTSEDRSVTNSFDKIRKIFRHAGRIRDAFLHLEMVQNTKVTLPEFEDEQQKIISAETESFILSGNRYLKKLKLAEKEFVKNIKKTGRKKVLIFYTGELEKINSTLSKNIFDEELHTARKRIKTLLYSQLMFGKRKRRKLNLQDEYLNNLQDLIGQWHDLNLTEGIFNQRKVKKERLMSTLNSKIKQLEDKIIAESADFCSKAMDSEKIKLKL